MMKEEIEARNTLSIKIHLAGGLMGLNIKYVWQGDQGMLTLKNMR